MTTSKRQERFDNYTCNNPDKYASDLRAARGTVRTIKANLKSDGAIALGPPRGARARPLPALPECQKQGGGGAREAALPTPVHAFGALAFA